MCMVQWYFNVDDLILTVLGQWKLANGKIARYIYLFIVFLFSLVLRSTHSCIMTVSVFSSALLNWITLSKYL